MFGLLAAAGGIAGGIVNTIGGISKAASGAKMMRRAQEAIDNYKRQTLQNAYSDVGISRLGADLMRQENARIAATGVDALRSAGTRGLGMVGQIQGQTNAMNQRQAAQLDQQMAQRNMAYAQDNARIRAMQESREEQDLAGLGRQLEVGRQDKYGGIQDIGQGLLSMSSIGANAMLGQGLQGMGNIDATPAVQKLATNTMPMAMPGMINRPDTLGVNPNMYAPVQPMGITGLSAPIYTG